MWLGPLGNTRLARGIRDKDVFAPIARIDSCPDTASIYRARLPLAEGRISSQAATVR